KKSFCAKHKEEGMVRIVYCSNAKCKSIPTYRKLFSTKQSHCRKHSSLNEYPIYRNNPICTVVNCNRAAHFFDSSDPNIYPVRCDLHKFHTDCELLLKTCIVCADSLYFPSNKDKCM